VFGLTANPKKRRGELSAGVPIRRDKGRRGGNPNLAPDLWAEELYPNVGARAAKSIVALGPSLVVLYYHKLSLYFSLIPGSGRLPGSMGILPSGTQARCNPVA
jgi:hypothetical protein